MSDLLCCPHCGSDYGFFRVTTMSGRGQTNYKFDGGVGENCELHECLTYREQKKAFCSECNKEIKALKAT